MLKESFIKKFYPANYVCHAFDHLERVHRFAMKIAKTEKNVNYKVLDAAAWFHDIARPLESKGKCKCHAEHGAKIVVPIIKRVMENTVKLKCQITVDMEIGKTLGEMKHLDEKTYITTT